MSLCANVVVLGPAMGFGYSAVAGPAMEKPKIDDVYLSTEQVSWMGGYLKIVLCKDFPPLVIIDDEVNVISFRSYRVSAGHACGLHSVESRDGPREKDQHVRDVVHLDGRLGDHLHVKQLYADPHWQGDLRDSHGHGIGADDGVRSGNRRSEMARHDGHLDQHLYRSRCPHRLHIRIHFQGER